MCVFRVAWPPCMYLSIDITMHLTNIHVFDLIKYHMRYSLAGIVKRSPSSIVLDVGITVSFSYQISDYIQMPITGERAV